MGKFTGLNDQEWAIVEPLIPYKWGITYSRTQPLHPRKILNTLIWVLTTRARWCDVPIGEQLSGSSKVTSWAISKFWEEKIGIQKSALPCSSCHA